MNCISIGATTFMNVIPREGVESAGSSKFGFANRFLVIPREGVESPIDCSMFITDPNGIVIPREGVESSLRCGEDQQAETLVIPREGVESIFQYKLRRFVGLQLQVIPREGVESELRIEFTELLQLFRDPERGS